MPLHSTFKILLGTWKTTGLVFNGHQTLTIEGSDTYEMILNENFILHKAEVIMGNENSQTLEIITPEGENSATMQFYNSDREQGIMNGEINHGEFKINGDNLKFNGSISEKEIKGNWYRRNKENNWEKFIELRLEKNGK